MRPVDKGPWPIKGNSTTKRQVFNDSSNAIRPLRQRTGMFCHLCEMSVTNLLAIEHIKSRDAFSRLANHWGNFLLICSHCNSRKRIKPVEVPYRKKYVWPHIHNTLLAFEVPLSGAAYGAMQVKSTLGSGTTLRDRADRMIALYELDASTTKEGGADQRFMLRQRAIDMASRRRIEYANGKCAVESIVDGARSAGFFTVWYTVFAAVPEVKMALLNEPEFFLSSAWFDANLDPVPRLLAEGI